MSSTPFDDAELAAQPFGADEMLPLIGGELLDKLADALDRYVVTPSPQARDGIALWIAATHGQAAWNHAPRLVINSPEKRCGKTRLLEVISATCHRPMMTANVSTAVLYRVIGAGESPPTILLDEADTIFGTKVKAEQNEDLRGLLNAGHGRSATTWRCVGPQQTPTEFSVYAMAALAGIGQMPDTITDRAVNLTMRRRATGETVSPYRESRDGPPLHNLRAWLAEWITEHLDDLRTADPVMPLEDRAADNWAPLVAVADLAGGRWPARARKAAQVLTAQHGEADAAESLNVQLLRDIATVWQSWPELFIGSTKLAAQLRSDENAPWAELDLSARRLFTRLKGFGIKPGHNAAKTERGYRRNDFADAMVRYLPPDAENAVEGASGNVQASETTSDLRVSSDAHEATDVSIRPEISIRPDVSAGHSDIRTLGRTGTHSPGDIPGACPICQVPTTMALVGTTEGLACRKCAPGISKGTRCADCGHPRELTNDGRCNPCHGAAIRRVRSA